MATPAVRPLRPEHAACLCALLLLPAGPALALRASPDPGFSPSFRPAVACVRTGTPPRLDGVLDDAAWRTAGRATAFTEFAPRDLGRPAVETEAYFAYDAENLYLAVVCHDDPGTVRASLCERDRIWMNDYVIFMIDTYGTQTWAYELGVNPYGIQGDLLWSTSNGEDGGYDIVFRSAGRLTETGWQAELAVPFASLRFPDRAEQTWRVNVWRNRPRASREQSCWAAVDRDDACWACQWGTLEGMRDVRQGRGVEVLPAFTARQEGTRGQDGSLADGDVLGEPSLGLKYSPNSAFTAEASLNPDFSQVESDAAQIDANTTFALSYPEKRPFFQEGAEMFDTWFGAVYTRSVNDPQFALKVTGRPGRTNMALLSARDENTPIILPFAERSGFVAAGRSWSNLLRLRHSLGDQAHLGLIATDRRYDGGGASTLGGVDGRIRLSRTAQVEAQLLLTRTDEPDDPDLTAELGDLTFDAGRHTAAFDGERVDGHAAYLALEQETRSWGVDLNYWERSPGFRADAGFEPRNDQRLGEASAYAIRRWTEGPLEWVQPSFTLARMWDFEGVRRDEWAFGGLTARVRRAQLQVNVNHMRSRERFAGQDFDGIWQTSAEVEAVPAAWMSGGVEARTGHRIARREEIMGEERAVATWVQLRPLDRLIFDGNWEWIRSEEVATGEELFEGYVARGKFTLQLTRELSTRLIVQYDHFARVWEADPLVTYRLSPFSIFYIGSTRDYARYGAGPDGQEQWRLAERSYFLKLQYLFRP